MNKEFEMELTNSLKRFNPIDGEIERMKKEYSTLTINGVQDSEGLKVVHSARMEVKAKRLEVDKIRKDLVADANTWTKAVNNEARRIREQLEPIEADLQTKEDAIKAEKERIKAEEQRQRQEFITGRINQMLDAGMTWNGAGYTIADVFIDKDDIEEYDELDFVTMLNDARRMKALMDEQEQKRQEWNQRYEHRSKILFQYGVSMQGDYFHKGNISIHINDLMGHSEENFLKLEEQFRQMHEAEVLEQQKKDAELEELRRLKAELEAEKSQPQSPQIGWMKSMKEKATAEAREESHNTVTEAERMIAEQSDLDKIKKLITDIRAVELPECESEDAVEAVGRCKVSFDRICAGLEEAVFSLELV